jgi:hypothetical protein
MGFLDLFRPKWKHSDPAVRIEAVKEFTAEDDAGLLAQVVRQDSDARVRRTALKKIADPGLLDELAQRDPDESLRKDAADKAVELLVSAALQDTDEARALTAVGRISAQRTLADIAVRSSLESVRSAALQQISDDRCRAEVVRRGSSDSTLRTRALAAITDTDVLRDLACSDAVKEVVVMAVGKLTERETLEAVLRKAKSKAARSAAQEKLDAMSPQPAGKAVGTSPAPKARTQNKQAGERPASPHELLCQRLELASKTDEFDEVEGFVAGLRAEWAALGPMPPRDPLAKRFERAASRFQENVTARAKKSSRGQAAGNAVTLPVAARAQELAQQAAMPKAAPTPEELAKQAAIRERKLQEEAARAAAATQRQEQDQVEQQRRDAARALRQAEQRANKAEQEAKEQAEAEKRAAEQKLRVEQQGKNQARLTEQCQKLEELTGKENLSPKQAEQALKAAHDVVVAANPLPREQAHALRTRYDEARAKLVIRLSELRDAEQWNRFANVPKLDALCQKAEILLKACDEEGIDMNDVSGYLKQLQAEWKDVGPAPKEKSEALWARFKATCDKVYERTRAASDGERSQNLAKREALLAKAEALGEITDWKAASETIKQLQADWKATGPVAAAAREQGEALWTRFKTVCDAFFEKRKAFWAERDSDRAQNQTRKEELCVRVERLRSSQDWKATSELLKQYQAEWKEIGPAPKEQNEALWQRFRAACDVFFEKRKVAFEKLDEERQGNLKKKEALVEKAANLAAREDIDQDAAESELKQIQQDWKHIGPAPREQNEALWQRFRAACDQVFQRGREAIEIPPELLGGKFSNKLPLSGLLAQMQEGSAAPEAVTAKAAPKSGPHKAGASAVSPSTISGAWEQEANSQWGEIDDIITSGQTPPPGQSSGTKPESGNS